MSNRDILRNVTFMTEVGGQEDRRRQEIEMLRALYTLHDNI